MLDDVLNPDEKELLDDDVIQHQMEKRKAVAIAKIGTCCTDLFFGNTFRSSTQGSCSGIPSIAHDASCESLLVGPLFDDTPTVVKSRAHLPSCKCATLKRTHRARHAAELHAASIAGFKSRMASGALTGATRLAS